ncbi:MAG TPA: type III-A CRISPR-associated RAMP protein Csm3, partial [Bacteroidetes bacterium]|nr:type III-A CRISPR-associated RAMP protein Csm3 [Bacteroidota bacterium]
GEGGFTNLELDYTEGKWENTLDRLTSAANPRQLERVPAGAKFNFSLVFNIFGDDAALLNMVFEALRLVQDDYLGGSGSRGYGQVVFENILLSYKSAENYKKQESAQEIRLFPTLDEVSLNNLPIEWGENHAQD